MDSNPTISLPNSIAKPEAPSEAIPATSAESPVRPESSFRPTNDLQRLLQSVRDLPDIRSEAVAESQEQFANGELVAQQTIRETAQALLDAQAFRQ